ncbi:MAG: OmpA family protein [Rhodoblastus sp.]
MNRPASQPEFEFDRLKQLLLRPETDRLEARVDALESRVGAPDRLEQATSEILVEAFRKAEIARHRELAGAVAPVVVAAIRSEIKNSKDMMVEALYPITGRLVAAAVANAFRDLVADLNERIDRSMSTRYWRLRLQALRTGRPVSELLLADAQRPSLRRLLLLERGSGRLVASWHADAESDDQSELVSGLIAAITEFASSVYGSRSGELRTLDLGEARVFLRGAPVYLVAAECAGALRPEHEREVDDAFLSLVSRVDHAPDQANPALAQMAEALFRQSAPAEKKSKLPLILAGCVALGLLAWWASGPILHGVYDRRIEAAFAAAQAAQPGLDAFPLRVSIDHASRTVTLAGLAPSDAAAAAVADALKGPAAPYAVVARTTSVGAVAQLQDIRKRQDEIADRIAQMSASAKEAETRLAALTSSSNEAAAMARAEAKDISGKLAALAAATARTPRDRLIALVADSAVYFSTDDTLVDRRLAEQRAGEIAAAMKNTDLSLRVVGYTDPTGSAKLNLGIAQKRSNAVVDMLVAQGVDRSRLQIVTRSSANIGATTADPRERRVTFELSSPDEPHP